eukprot:Nitzschia sp. Nitz4//scaffold95_size97785//28046//29301//NITZ4_004660-RA/size97785-augustus-gene-0.106-mRNA-1//-1//CDS//3329560451//656//frame0
MSRASKGKGPPHQQIRYERNSVLSCASSHFHRVFSQIQIQNIMISGNHPHTAIVALASLLLGPLQGSWAAPSEPYVYTVYYDGHGCEGSIVSLNPHVSGDDEVVQGTSNVNSTMCSVQSICLADLDADLCDLYAINRTAVAHTDINKDGNIYQCDTSNEDVDQAQCRYIRGCGNSSLFPDCNFVLMTTSDIFEDLDQVRNLNVYDDEGLALTSYMSFYSDANCTEFEGTQGIVAGETEFQGVSESLSCEQALACVFNPEGEWCINGGGLTGESMTIHTQPAMAHAILCDDETDESCAEVDANACMRSEFAPSCWYRLSTSYRLFAEPDLFFVSTKYPVAIEGQDEPTAAPTAEATESESSSVMAGAAGWSTLLLFVQVALFGM